MRGEEWRGVSLKEIFKGGSLYTQEKVYKKKKKKKNLTASMTSITVNTCAIMNNTK
jgi:hypothetical protein